VTDLTDLGARELAAVLRARRASPAEALDAYVARIDRLNPALNAIVELDLERATMRARRLVREDGATRPLFGVPMTVKGSLRVRGRHAVVGNPDAPRSPAATDSEVVRCLRAAGAVIMGTTNVARDLSDFQTDNPVHGRTANPWDRSRTAGGSSGGSAAAVAARISPIEVGSDIAGSVRVPAAFTGVLGLKPSAGLVPQRGQITQPVLHPRGGGLAALATIGPMARDVADLAVALGVLAGRAINISGLRAGDLRLAFVAEIPGLRVSAAVGQAVEAVVADAARAGVRISSFTMPGDPRAGHRLWQELHAAASTHGTGWAARRPGLARRVGAVRHAWAAALPPGLALLLPTVMCTAFTHRPTGTPIDVDGEAVPYWGLARYTEPFNLTGLPAMSLPATLDQDGLPVGVQLVGRHGSDPWLLGVAALLESLVPPLPAPEP